MRFLLACILVAGELLLLSAGACSAKDYRFESTYEYEVDDGFDLIIENVSGDVTVSYRPGDELVLTAIKEVEASSRSEAEEIEEEIEIRVKATADRLDIETRRPERRREGGFLRRLLGLGETIGRVHYSVEVPVSAAIFVRATSGDISVDGMSGRLDVETTSGDLDIVDFTGDCRIRNTSGDYRLRDMVGDININSTSADAVIDNVEGDVELRCTSGDSELHWVVGEVLITKTSGDIRIQNCSGDVDINTSSGDVFVEQLEGGLFVSSASGDIEAQSELSRGGKYQLESISGDILLRVPRDASGRVDIATSSGNIDTSLVLEVQRVGKNRLEGVFGGGGVLIELKTTSGDICLEGL